MRNKLAAVSNSGPIIHLSEIDSLKSFNIAREIHIPAEVFNETKGIKFAGTKRIPLDKKHKDISIFITDYYGLGLGEAEAISLCLQEKTSLFFTDDLEARTIAKSYNLEVHGTIGILVRAFKQKISTETEVIDKLKIIREKSSLYLTKDILEWSIRKIKRNI